MNRSGAGSTEPKREVFSKSIIGQGLGRTLLVWFLILALLPATIISYMSCTNAQNNIHRETNSRIVRTTESKLAAVGQYFKGLITDLEVQSNRNVYIQFLNDLHEGYKARGKPLEEYVKSQKWTEICSEQSQDLRFWKQIRGFYDAFLIDGDGNILFSVAEESDPGTNKFTGKYKSTHFAKTLQKVKETGILSFTAFDNYAPTNDASAGFLISPMVDGNEDRVGCLACQIPTDQLNTIMQSGLMKTEDCYLIGADLRVRAQRPLADSQTILIGTTMTEQSQSWFKHDIEDRIFESTKGEPQSISTKTVDTVLPSFIKYDFIPDDRQTITDEDNIVLVIEDDPGFAKILMDLARNKGYKCLAAGTGRSGIQLANDHKLRAILPDLGLPDINGLVVLDDLKQNLKTRHIPVHVISGKAKKTAALEKGAVGFLTKPCETKDIEEIFIKFEQLAEKTTKRLLVIDDDEKTRIAIHKLFENKDISISDAANGEEVLQLLNQMTFDCAILDLSLGDMTIFQDPKSSESSARPKAALEIAAPDHILALDQIGSFLRSEVNDKCQT